MLARSTENREKIICGLSLGMSVFALLTKIYLSPRDVEKSHKLNSSDFPPDNTFIFAVAFSISYGFVHTCFKVYDRCHQAFFQPKNDDGDRLDDALHNHKLKIR